MNCSFRTNNGHRVAGKVLKINSKTVKVQVYRQQHSNILTHSWRLSEKICTVHIIKGQVRFYADNILPGKGY